MGRLNVLLIIILMGCCYQYSHADYVKIVLDEECVKAVAGNTAAQVAVENLHNNHLDSISKREKKLAEYTSTMATIKELLKNTLENINGFGTDSQYYIHIGKVSWEIVKDAPAVLKTINKASFPGKVESIMEVRKLVLKTQHLVNDFISIVNNAKIGNPLKHEAALSPSKDGYNLLNRTDRLAVTLRILGDLSKIKAQMEWIKQAAYYSTWNSMIFRIAPKEWTTVMGGYAIVKNVVNRFTGLYK